MCAFPIMYITLTGPLYFHRWTSTLFWCPCTQYLCESFRTVLVYRILIGSKELQYTIVIMRHLTSFIDMHNNPFLIESIQFLAIYICIPSSDYKKSTFLESAYANVSSKDMTDFPGQQNSRCRSNFYFIYEPQSLTIVLQNGDKIYCIYIMIENER